MKRFVIFYAHYPFNVVNLHPDKEIVNAETLSEAMEKVKAEHGKDKIEIFNSVCHEYTR